MYRVKFYGNIDQETLFFKSFDNAKNYLLTGGYNYKSDERYYQHEKDGYLDKSHYAKIRKFSFFD